MERIFTYRKLIRVSSIVQPIAVRSCIILQKLPCHHRCTLNDLPRAIIEPCKILGDIQLLEQIERNIVVQMIFIIHTGTSACAVSIFS